MLTGIVVGDTATAHVKNPVKVRAARSRWDRRDRLREAHAQAAESA